MLELKSTLNKSSLTNSLVLDSLMFTSSILDILVLNSRAISYRSNTSFEFFAFNIYCTIDEEIYGVNVEFK